MTKANEKKLTKITDLIPDERNANLGTERGLRMLARSLREYGAGRSILVDKEGRVISGNKTVEQAVDIGLEDVIIVQTDGKQLVAVQRTDLDLEKDPAARELAYADNRTSEVNLEWDLDILANDWQDGVEVSKFWTQRELEVWLGHVDWGEPRTFEDIPEELPGASALKNFMNFESDEIYGIPALLPDMLVELPQPIDVWAGPDASDQNWDGWWLYCYGSDSIRGLNLARTVLSFYVDDYRFENWYNEPERYVSRMINGGIGLAVAPNFSLWYGAAQAVHIFNVFRSRWLARYMQEAGIAVIPDVNWAEETDFGFCLAGIPKEAPCISVQLQTVGNQAEAHRQRKGLERTIKELKPQNLLLYGGGEDTKKNIAGVIHDDLPVTWLESRVIRRHDRVMSRSAQEGGDTG